MRDGVNGSWEWIVQKRSNEIQVNADNTEDGKRLKHAHSIAITEPAAKQPCLQNVFNTITRKNLYANGTMTLAPLCEAIYLMMTYQNVTKSD